MSGLYFKPALSNAFFTGYTSGYPAILEAKRTGPS